MASPFSLQPFEGVGMFSGFAPGIKLTSTQDVLLAEEIKRREEEAKKTKALGLIPAAQAAPSGFATGVTPGGQKPAPAPTPTPQPITQPQPTTGAFSVGKPTTATFTDALIGKTAKSTTTSLVEKQPTPTPTTSTKTDFEQQTGFKNITEVAKALSRIGAEKATVEDMVKAKIPLVYRPELFTKAELNTRAEYIAPGIVKSWEDMSKKERQIHLASTANLPALQFAGEIGKGLIRGASQVEAGIGKVIGWLGQELQYQATQSEIASRKAGLPMSDMDMNIGVEVGEIVEKFGNNTSDFISWAQQQGSLAKHINYQLQEGKKFLGGTQNAVVNVAESVPLLAAAAGVSVISGQPWVGAGAIGLIEGANAVDESQKYGVDYEKARQVGALVTVGTSLLEVYPMKYITTGGFSSKGLTKMATSALLEGGEEGLQEVWKNLVAIWGYDESRKWTQGVMESIVLGAAAGGLVGGFYSNSNPLFRNLTKMEAQAKTKGISGKDFDLVKEQLTSLVIEQSPNIEKALENSLQKTTIPATQPFTGTLKSVAKVGEIAGKVPTKIETPETKIPTIEGKEIIPELQPLVEKAQGLSQQEFIKQFNEGLNAQNLTTKETAQNTLKEMQKNGLTLETFYNQAVKKPTLGEIKAPEVVQKETAKPTTETQLLPDERELKIQQQLGREEMDVVPQKSYSKDNIKTNLKTVENFTNKEVIAKAPPQMKALKDTTHWDGHIELPNETNWQGFRRTVEDMNIRLKVLNKEIEKVSGNDMQENLDIYAQKDMLSRKQSALIKKVEKQKTDFVSNLVADNITIKEIDDVLHAEHAFERNTAMNEKRLAKGEELIDGLSGMTNEQANKILKTARPEVKEWAAKARQIANKALDFEVEQGLTTPEEAQMYQNKYKNYVPLFRDIDDTFLGIGRGVDIKGKESKQAFGSEKPVTSPLGNVFYRAERAQIRAIKNQIGTSIIKLTNEYPFLKDIFEIEKQQYIPRFDKNGELQRLDPRLKLGDNTIGAKIDGKQYYITIKDNKIAQALKNTNLVKTNAFIRSMKGVIGIWSSFKTRWRPEFLITNFERDMGEALINLGVEKGMLKESGKTLRRDTVKGIFKAQKEIWNYVRGKTTTAEEFFDLGGDVGHFWLQEVKTSQKNLLDLEKQIKNEGWQKIKNPIRATSKAIDDLQSMIELGTRYSAYKELTKRGMSKEKAIQRTSDLTVNFARQGEMSSYLKAAYGFINPAIQGSSKVFRTISSKQGRGRVARSITGLVGLGFVIRMISMLVDDEGDEQISDWAKNHKITIAIGNNKTVTLWSMPYGYSVFYSMGSNIAEWVYNKKTEAEVFKNVLETTVTSFSPFEVSDRWYVPTLLKPIADINANETWYGGKVHPEQAFTNTPKPNFDSYFDSTEGTYKFITKFLSDLTGGTDTKSGLIDIYPNDLKYLFDQYFGGPFEFIMSSVEAGAKSLEGTFNPNQTPFVRQFYREGKPQQWSYGVIYDTLEKAWKKDVSDMEKERFIKAVRIGLEEKVFDEERASGYIKDFFKAQYQIQGDIESADNIERINNMPKDERDLLIGTYGESTQERLRDTDIIFTGKIYQLTGPFSTKTGEEKASTINEVRNYLDSFDIDYDKAKSLLDDYFTEQEKTLKNPTSKTHLKTVAERQQRLKEIYKEVFK